MGNLISSRHSLYSLFLSLLSEPGCVSLKELLESTTQRGLQAASLLLHLPNMLRDTTCCPETIRSEPATTLEVGKGHRRYREGKYSRNYYLHTLLLPKASSHGPVDPDVAEESFPTGASDDAASDQKTARPCTQLPVPHPTSPFLLDQTLDHCGKWKGKQCPRLWPAGRGPTGSIAPRVAAYGNDGCPDSGNPRREGEGRNHLVRFPGIRLWGTTS